MRVLFEYTNFSPRRQPFFPKKAKNLSQRFASAFPIAPLSTVFLSHPLLKNYAISINIQSDNRKIVHIDRECVKRIQNVHSPYCIFSSLGLE